MENTAVHAFLTPQSNNAFISISDITETYGWPNHPKRNCCFFVFPFLLNLFSFFPDLLPENCVEEKTKSFDPNGIMAEINHRDRPGVHLKWVSQTKCEVSDSLL